MSQLDTYRNTLLKKQEDISKLNQDMAKEQAKNSTFTEENYIRQGCYQPDKKPIHHKIQT